jgi:acetyltransferase-like isoleucine patch superfamily enzyme
MRKPRVSYSVKSTVKGWLYLPLTPFGAAFCDRKYKVTTLWKHVFWQKILRINGSAPWPVHWSSKVIRPDKIVRGTRCPGLSMGCYLDGRNGIFIGQNVWIGPRVSLISMNHDTRNYRNYVVGDSIVIGDDCWLGTGAIILPGVKLGDHVVVAAGAVVTHSFPEGDLLLAGVPAAVVKKLAPYSE